MIPKYEYYFNLFILSGVSINLYEKSVALYIDNTSFTLEENRINMYTQLGLVSIHSQFAERQFYSYAYLFDAFGKMDESEIILKLHDLTNDIRLKIRELADLDQPYSHFLSALTYFSNLIPLEQKYIDLVKHAINNRNFLIHHSIIDDPTIMYDREKILDLTKKAIYCIVLLYQIIYEIEIHFYKAVSSNYPEIGNKLHELKDLLSDQFANISIK